MRKEYYAKNKKFVNIHELMTIWRLLAPYVKQFLQQQKKEKEKKK